MGRGEAEEMALGDLEFEIDQERQRENWEGFLNLMTTILNKTPEFELFVELSEQEKKKIKTFIENTPIEGTSVHTKPQLIEMARRIGIEAE